MLPHKPSWPTKVFGKLWVKVLPRAQQLTPRLWWLKPPWGAPNPGKTCSAMMHWQHTAALLPRHYWVLLLAQLVRSKPVAQRVMPLLPETLLQTLKPEKQKTRNYRQSLTTLTTPSKLPSSTRIFKISSIRCGQPRTSKLLPMILRGKPPKKTPAKRLKSF